MDCYSLVFQRINVACSRVTLEQAMGQLYQAVMEIQ